MSALLELLGLPWVGALIGIVTFFLGLLLREKRATRISFQYWNMTLISGYRLERTAPRGLSIRYNGRPIERLTLTRVAIWNSGNTTIDSKALVAEDPLRLLFGGEVFEVRVIRRSRKVTGLRAGIDAANPRRVLLDFNFIDPKDGIKLEVFHTGKAEPIVEGTVQGMPEGVANLGPFVEVHPAYRHAWLAALTLFAFVAGAGGLMVYTLLPRDRITWVHALILLFFAALPMWDMLRPPRERRKFPGTLAR